MTCQMHIFNHLCLVVVVVVVVVVSLLQLYVQTLLSVQFEQNLCRHGKKCLQQYFNVSHLQITTLLYWFLGSSTYKYDCAYVTFAMRT